MSDTLQLRLVDVFADQPFAGNPAGVILDADRLSEAQMRAVAREINASETAFISGANDIHQPPRLRWFTPAAEVQFCGHATLAAAHALAEVLHLPTLLAKSDARLEFSTAAGKLTLTPELSDRESGRVVWWLDMPDPGLQPDHTNPVKLASLLGLRADEVDEGLPPMRTRDDDVILLVKRWRTLVELQPDFHELARLCRRRKIRGVCVATLETLSDFVHVVSRFFAPAVGVPEDPVTGSVHGPLAALLTINDLVPTAGGRAALNCLQGQPDGRTGIVRAIVRTTPGGYRVAIGGSCHTTIRGEMLLPAETRP